MPWITIVPLVEGEIRQFEDTTEERLYQLVTDGEHTPSFLLSTEEEEVRFKLYDGSDRLICQGNPKPDGFWTLREDGAYKISGLVTSPESFGDLKIEVYGPRRELDDTQYSMLERLLNPSSNLHPFYSNEEYSGDAAFRLWQRLEDGEPEVYQLAWGTEWLLKRHGYLGALPFNPPIFLHEYGEKGRAVDRMLPLDTGLGGEGIRREWDPLLSEGELHKKFYLHENDKFDK